MLTEANWASTVTMVDMVGLAVDPAAAVVYPEGWQSWTPTTAYPVTAVQHGPVDRRQEVLGYRGSMVQGGFIADGLLAVVPAPGEPVHIFSGVGQEVPRIAARPDGGILRITADGPLHHGTYPGTLDQALRAWAGERAVPLRPAPTVWCSWYHYFTGVTEADVIENLDAMARLDLPIDVVQLDDGYQTGIGDW